MWQISNQLRHGRGSGWSTIAVAARSQQGYFRPSEFSNNASIIDRQLNLNVAEKLVSAMFGSRVTPPKTNQLRHGSVERGGPCKGVGCPVCVHNFIEIAVHL